MRGTRLTTAAVVVLMLVSAGAARGAASDHVTNIWMDQGAYYGRPGDPVSYGIEIVLEGDSTIQSVSLLTPASNTFALSTGMAPPNWWWHEAYFDTPAGLAAYGDGNYAFTIQYAGGGSDTTTIPFSRVGGGPLVQPTQKPNITYPTDGTMNVPVTPTFSWDAVQDANANQIWIEWNKGPLFDEGPPEGSMGLPVTATNLTPGSPLLSGTDYQAWLDFLDDRAGTNTDGIPFDVNKYIEVTTQFTTTPEPATMGLIVIGVAGMLARRGRKS